MRRRWRLDQGIHSYSARNASIGFTFVARLAMARQSLVLPMTRAQRRLDRVSPYQRRGLSDGSTESRPTNAATNLVVGRRSAEPLR